MWFERALADWLLPESSACWLDFACLLVVGLWFCWFLVGFWMGMVLPRFCRFWWFFWFGCVCSAGLGLLAWASCCWFARLIWYLLYLGSASLCGFGVLG